MTSAAASPAGVSTAGVRSRATEAREAARAQGRRRLDPVDAAWLQMEEPDNLMMITVLMRFEGPVDVERFRADLLDRLVARYPRFARRIDNPTSGSGRSAWVPDEAFEVADHVTETALPAPGDEEALRTLVSALLSRPLDLSRSPWHLTLVQDVPDPDGSGRPTGAMVARLHHSLADGMALAALLLDITDEREAQRRQEAEDADEGPGTAVAERAGAPGVLSRLRGSAPLAGRVVVEFLRLLLSRADPPNPLRGRLSRTKDAGWTGRLPLERVKQVAAAGGVSVNDVLMTVAAGALRSATLARGLDPVDVRASVPVNMRPLDRPVGRDLGNRFGVFFTPLPLSVPDPVARLRAVSSGMTVSKGGAQAAMSLVVLTVLGRVPRLAERVLVRVLGTKSSCVVTNVPGPREPLTLAGSRISSIQFWVPQAGRVSVGVSVLSYAGTVTVGVACDREVFADPQQVADAVAPELEVLAAAVGA